MQQATIVCLIVLGGVTGCVSPDDMIGRLRSDEIEWDVAVEDAMAPDFSGMGPSFPVLLIHQHHVLSARQQEEMRNVVCSRMDGGPLAILRADATREASAPCPPPIADAATGRLFLERAEFEKASPRAVVVMDRGCGGGAILLTEELRDFVVATERHDFSVRLYDNGTFLVDGRWVAPGTALKLGYYEHRGDRRDEEYTRVVFEAPGQWLLSRVGKDTPDIDELTSRPQRSSGLAIDVPLSPASLRGPLELAMGATPGGATGVAELRAVHAGDRLTEIMFTLTTKSGLVTWYGAGRTGDSIRLLGAERPSDENASVAPDALDPLLDLEWRELRVASSAGPTDVRLVANASWTTVGPLALTAPSSLSSAACDEGCVRVFREGSWQSLVAPRKEPTEGAATFHVLQHGEPAPVEGWWHVLRE